MPATTLLAAFAAGAVVTVPPILWLGVGRREVVRLVPAPAATAIGQTRLRASVSDPLAPALKLTPVLKQALRDIQRWAKPSKAAPSSDIGGTMVRRLKPSTLTLSTSYIRCDEASNFDNIR